MKPDLHWMPLAFCAFLSILPLSGSDSGWWKPAYYSFLPLCFYWVGSVTSTMHRELIELRKQVVERRQENGG